MSTPPEATVLRIRLFVDFWNFSPSLRTIDPAFKVHFQKLGPTLCQEAGRLIDPTLTTLYQGTHVYGSYDPGKPNDVRLRHWFRHTLDRMPGVSVVLQERQRKRGYPRCPHCQTEVLQCVSCNSDMRGTEEKGVDTRIATDMISLAWVDGYNCAVLLSSDKDFVPVAEFLQTRSIKVIHAGFPPQGSQLSQKCWGSLSIPVLRGLFQRP